MKAILIKEFGGPEVMQIGDAAPPEPGDGEVLIGIKAAGVNPVDTYIRAGQHSVKPELPYTPGKDAAGVVERVGSGVERFKRGDRVFTADTLTGTYAEFAVCREDQLGCLPDNVSFEQGAGVFTPYATAYRALFQKARARAGETVLVHGASGGVGIAAVQFAVNAGLKVIGTASSEEGRELVLANGAAEVFDHSADGYLDEIVAASGGRGPDIILEMLANVNLENDLKIIAKFGRVVVIGSRGSLEFTPRLAMAKDAAIYGMLLFNTPAEEMREAVEIIAKGLGAGYLNPNVE
ncbi:MAG TPA: NADPH:quinone reductase, partial [Pyrinomonadaceae bacterium]|nr:NADPH:quinone reductase [Pyrinomonadaceae bacterium]